MSAARTIQAASIPYLDNLSATASALYTSSCLLFWLAFFTSTCSPITVFWVCRIQFLPQGCGGSLAHSLLHLILRVCWNQYQFNHLLLGLIVSRFGCIILLLAIPANFLFHQHFLHAHVSYFSHVTPRWRPRGGLPHQVLLFTLFFCWNVHSSSFCTEGAVAISISCSRGTESPRYKVKFVTRCCRDIFAWR